MIQIKMNEYSFIFYQTDFNSVKKKMVLKRIMSNGYLSVWIYYKYPQNTIDYFKVRSF